MAASAPGGLRHEIVLVRHGETEWSLAGRHTSRTDLPLTERGRERARALAGQLAGRRFAVVLCSPLRRARETCELAGFGGVAELCEDLREWDYGEYEGRTTAEIRRHDPGWTIWSGRVPGGESIEQVASRAAHVVNAVAGVDGDVALFAHGHILRVLATCWLGLAPDAGRLLALDTASLSVLDREHETRVVRSWNEDATLVEEPVTG